MTSEELKKVNESLESIDVKGKGYVMVNKRIQAFRELYPEGTITTEILENANGIVTMKATIMDDKGKVLATGLSYEKESNGYINKTSYIENCETSAVGRALGFLGIGIDGSMASAEEVANAMLQQSAQKPIDKVKVKIIKDDIAGGNIKESDILKYFGINKVEDMSEEQFRKYAQQKQNREEKNKKNG